MLPGIVRATTIGPGATMSKPITEDLDFSSAPEWARRYRAGDFPPYAYTVDLAGFAVAPAEGRLEALVTVRGREPYAGYDAWPGGFVEWETDADSEAAALREFGEETGRRPLPGRPAVEYMEKLAVYDANGRDPRQFAGSPEGGSHGVRVVSSGFIGLLRRGERVPRPDQGEDPAEARWADVYGYLPWEDRRDEVGRAVGAQAARALRKWAGRDRARATRIDFAFGAEWNEERVAERLTLMEEAGLVEEAHRDLWGRVEGGAGKGYGRVMAFDHRRILADALARFRGKIKYVPRFLMYVMEPEFTLAELHRAVESIAGRPVDYKNFRRLVTRYHRLVEPTGVHADPGPRGGRAPELYRFVAGTEHLRLDPSMQMPWSRAAG